MDNFNNFGFNDQVKCWSFLAMPAIVLAIAVYFGKFILRSSRMPWILKFGVIAIIVVSALSLMSQAILCFRNETEKSLAVGISASGLSSLAISAIFVVAILYWMLLSFPGYWSRMQH